MRKINFIEITAVFLIFSFSLSITPAQSIEGINENIGGGSKPVQSESKNNNTFLYIAAGVVVVGLLVWKVILDRKEAKQKNNEKTDSAKVSIDGSILNHSSNYKNELREVQNKMPFDIFLGLHENDINGLGKHLKLGLKIKL